MSINQELFNEVWERTKKRYLTSQEQPKAYVLGGQSGSGKSYLIKEVKEELNNNVIVINGDDFRKYHPDYEKLQKEQGKDSPKFTAQFAGEMTEAILKKAIYKKYNIVIEGTFRTSETPLKTLKQLKDSAYETNVYIKATSKEQSWQNCLERYNKMLELDPREARYTDKTHHDLIVDNLAQNVEIVSKSPYVDNLKVFTTKGKIYDRNIDKSKDLKSTIQQELDRDIALKEKQKRVP
ncbi:MAG: zeta toxin family protein [Sulfurimonas sp.]|jgi:UDP-N-acetylglucosamine kinase|nr:zeta toxin family protein [Sulfurimonadaceae bacterium]